MTSKKFVAASVVCAMSLMNGIAQAAPKDADGRAGSWRTAAQGAPSLKAAKSAVEKHPQDAVANNDLGWAYRQNGDLTQAESFLRIATKSDAKLAQAHSNLSVVLVDLKKFDEAKTEAAQAVSLDPENAIYRAVLGNALSKTGDRKEAIVQYRKAIALKPDYENALYNLGRVLKEDGQINESKLVLVDALKFDPKDDRVLMLLDDMTGDTATGAAPAKQSLSGK